ncbi:hypothetical protein [Pseudomonas syringae]|uniref:Uncharacterized protein n=1 Tax=Pseudomonas syringae pv. aptata TaxID=83167 RepID=A0A0Q0ICR3_PSEAP|nr:hypothetical protein [Pseudomonas syringae]KPY98946.1 Uncharacterized protein ALO85_03108 [Pseudomonas syringae pv. aptata]MDP5164118.1 hypothetical protein [Pseudomonas syringae pv. aptata str. DSM 50252]RMO46212.1 hypothetical protein ALQ40_00391 [Pseudomonas syringae]RMO67230.1 hypothetical protein ALQ37_01927 [Pseudomonas syringae pv. aptata]
MNVVSGLDEAAVEGLVRSQATFEVIGLRGNFKAGIKMVETKIESLGMKCRVKSDTKSALAQGGAFGAVLGILSAPVTIAAGVIGTAACVGHALSTYDPDYEILKDYINKKLIVRYKK